MAKINQNDFAKEVMSIEGLKIQVGIGQSRELTSIIIGLLGREWLDGNEIEVIRLLKEHAAKLNKRQLGHGM
jgi:hypothetical protein